MYYLFNPPLYVLSLFLFFFLFFFKERKSCPSLTGYIITVKFMLFCNLETSCSMAHLIKHLKRNCVGPWLWRGGCEEWGWRARFDLGGRGCSTACPTRPAQRGEGLWVLVPTHCGARNFHGHLRGMQTRVIFPPSRGGGWGRGKRPKLQRWSLDRQDGPFLEGKKDQMWEHWAREILSALGKESFFPVWQVIELCQFPRNQLVCGVLLCLTLWDPMDCSPPGPSVQRILQGRILEWVAISSSKGSSWPRDQTWVSFVSCIGRWVIYLLSHRGSPVSQLDLVLFFNPAALAGSPRGVAQSRTAPQANQCPLLCFPELACSVPSAWNAYPHVCLCSLFRVYFRNHPLTPPSAPLIILSFCSCSFLDARTSFLGWHCLLSHWAHFLDWASRGWRGSMVHLPPWWQAFFRWGFFKRWGSNWRFQGSCSAPSCQ